jgi:hypothetical protein
VKDEDMIGSKFIAWTVAIVAALGLCGVSFPTPTVAQDAPAAQVPEAQAPEASAPASAGAETPRPQSPIRFKTVDYKEGDESGGTLKLAGAATPGSTLISPSTVSLMPRSSLTVTAIGAWKAN